MMTVKKEKRIKIKTLASDLPRPLSLPAEERKGGRKKKKKAVEGGE
jgi:hypothetical protein